MIVRDCTRRIITFQHLFFVLYAYFKVRERMGLGEKVERRKREASMSPDNALDYFLQVFVCRGVLNVKDT